MVNPDVSVIITCHNLEAYLNDAIHSVRAQTCQQDIELIVLHDGCDKPLGTSADMTVIGRDKRGVAMRRDEGFRMSAGAHILFLDADDMLAENFLQECFKHIDAADIIYPNWLLWSYWGDKSPQQNAWYNAPTKITASRLYRFNQVVVTALMHRDVYEDIGPFDSTLAMFEDWDLWIRALIHGYRFKRANTHLKYRQRTEGRNRQADEIQLETARVIRQRYASKMQIVKKEMELKKQNCYTCG